MGLLKRPEAGFIMMLPCAPFITLQAQQFQRQTHHQYWLDKGLLALILPKSVSGNSP
jgi:hypothetical protein